jgi:2-dehydropantoate 2-reductase
VYGLHLSKRQQAVAVKALVIGAGVIGCFTTALLNRKGLDVSLLARGTRADRLERDGLQMRDGLTNDTSSVELEIVRAPATEQYDLALVCTQGTQRDALMPFLQDLPGRPIIWYLGNTTRGYEDATHVLGEDRVLGGFPGVGGTWDGDTLVYADREKPSHRPFDRLILGEAHPAGAAAAKTVSAELARIGMNMQHYVPIMAWHWCHVAFILPLAAAVYRHDQDLAACAGDRDLLIKVMRATRQALDTVQRSGLPVLPRSLNLMRWLPPALGVSRVARLLQSDFGRVAIAGHAAVARAEMKSLSADLLALAAPGEAPDLRELLASV